MKVAIEITYKEYGQTFKDCVIYTGNSFAEIELTIKNMFDAAGKEGLNSPDFEYFISNVRQLP